MKLKKFTALTILLGVMTLNFAPAYSITLKKKQENVPMKETKLGYINYDWWEDFNDENLNGYILRAIENNQDLKIATLRVDEAYQAMKAQFAAELPSVTVGALPAGAKMPGSTEMSASVLLPIIASYELDYSLKNHDKTKSAKKTYEASKDSEKAVYISIISAVGNTYYNIVKLDKMIALQDEIVLDRAQILKMMKLSNEEGLVSTSDLVKAEKAYILSTADLIELKKTRNVLLNALAVLVGDSPDNVQNYKRISYDDLKIQKEVPEFIKSDIIEARPDYQTAIKMVEKAKIDVRVAKKEFLPAINLMGALSFNYINGMFNQMNWTNSLLALGGGAILPLFTGGRKIANLKINKNRYEQVLNKYYKTNLVAIQEVNNALSNLKLDEEKYQTHLKSLEMEKKDFGFSKKRYDEGVISYLDLIQKKETMLVTQKMTTASKMDLYINQINLYKAVAGADVGGKVTTSAR